MNSGSRNDESQNDPVATFAKLERELSELEASETDLRTAPQGHRDGKLNQSTFPKPGVEVAAPVGIDIMAAWRLQLRFRHPVCTGITTVPAWSAWARSSGSQVS